jgi:hypothetical protein
MLVGLGAYPLFLVHPSQSKPLHVSALVDGLVAPSLQRLITPGRVGIRSPELRIGNSRRHQFINHLKIGLTFRFPRARDAVQFDPVGPCAVTVVTEFQQHSVVMHLCVVADPSAPREPARRGEGERGAQSEEVAVAIEHRAAAAGEEGRAAF